MERVNQYGEMLNIPMGQPFNKKEKDRELTAALLQQYRLRAIRDGKPNP